MNLVAAVVVAIGLLQVCLLAQHLIQSQLAVAVLAKHGVVTVHLMVSLQLVVVEVAQTQQQVVRVVLGVLVVSLMAAAQQFLEALVLQDKVLLVVLQDV